MVTVLDGPTVLLLPHPHAAIDLTSILASTAEDVLRQSPQAALIIPIALQASVQDADSVSTWEDAELQYIRR